MGDRDRPANNSSAVSLVTTNGLLEEERALLGEGITYGELRDEIYCQVMKQLNGNPNPCVYLYFAWYKRLTMMTVGRACFGGGSSFVCCL